MAKSNESNEKAEAETKAKAEAEAKAEAKAKPKTRKGFVVAKGKSLTSRRGIIDAGEECTGADFVDGPSKDQDAHLAGLVKAGLVEEAVISEGEG